MNSPLADLIIGNFVKTYTHTDLKEKTLNFDLPISDDRDDSEQNNQFGAVQTMLQKRKEAEDEKFVKVSGTDRSRLIENDYFENPDSIFQKCNRKQLIEAQKLMIV